MGNLESVQKKYTTEQLKQTEKGDIQTLSTLDTEIFDDNYVMQKVATNIEKKESMTLPALERP